MSPNLKIKIKHPSFFTVHHENFGKRPYYVWVWVAGTRARVSGRPLRRFIGWLIRLKCERRCTLISPQFMSERGTAVIGTNGTFGAIRAMFGCLHLSLSGLEIVKVAIGLIESIILSCLWNELDLTKPSNFAKESMWKFGNDVKLQLPEHFTGEQSGTDRTGWPFFNMHQNQPSDISNVVFSREYFNYNNHFPARLTYQSRKPQKRAPPPQQHEKSSTIDFPFTAVVGALIITK